MPANENARYPAREARCRDVRTLNFPILARPKLNGVRATVQDGKMYSLGRFPCTNKRMSALFEHEEFNGMDGHLFFREANAPFIRNMADRVFTPKGGRLPQWADPYWYVSDTMDDKGFAQRLAELKLRLDECSPELTERIKFIDHRLINGADELYQYERECNSRGFEGVIVKYPDLGYYDGLRTAAGNKVTNFMCDHRTYALAEIVKCEPLNLNMANDEVIRKNLAKQPRVKAADLAKGLVGTMWCRHVDHTLWSGKDGYGRVEGAIAGDVDVRNFAGQSMEAMAKAEGNDGLFPVSEFGDVRRPLWSDQEKLIGHTFRYALFSVKVVREHWTDHFRKPVPKLINKVSEW